MGLFSRFRKSQKVEVAADEVMPDSAAVSAALSSPEAPPAQSSHDVLAAFRDKISELSGGQIAPDTIDTGAILFDFGYVDSLSAVTLIAWIDDKFGVVVTELDLVGALNNLGALAEYVKQRQGS